MLHIYLTRHGETQWNIENRLQGWKNSELTENGISHARLLGERLSQTSLNAIYSSSSERALQTVKYVNAGRDIPIFIDPDLKELSFGEWEGKTHKEIEEIDPKEYFHFWNEPKSYNHQPHKGEGLADFKKRVEEAFKRIIAENTSGNLLIVTHGVVIKAILSFVMDIPTEKMWETPFIHGTSLSVFQWDGEKFTVQMLGDTSHIEKICI